MLKNKFLICVLVGCMLVLSGCQATTYNADGTFVKSEIDYQSVKLTAMATVAAWAASQKNGIDQKDADAVEMIFESLSEYHADGSEINPKQWTEAAQKQVPVRYRGLAVVMTEMFAYQLKKYGLSTEPVVLGSTSYKLLSAIREGVMMGIAPYTGKGKMAA